MLLEINVRHFQLLLREQAVHDSLLQQGSGNLLLGCVANWYT